MLNTTIKMFSCWTFLSILKFSLRLRDCRSLHFTSLVQHAFVLYRLFACQWIAIRCSYRFSNLCDLIHTFNKRIKAINSSPNVSTYNNLFICTPFCPYASFRFGNRHRVIPTQHKLKLKTNKIFKQPEMHSTPKNEIGQIETQHPKIRCKRDGNGISALFTAYLQIEKIDFSLATLRY